MITAALYKIITDFVNNAQSRGTDIIYYINKMNTDLNSSEINTENINKEKLEAQISTTSNVLSSRHSEKVEFMLVFVFKLQEYIYNSYGSINDFLSVNNTQVLPVFAEISEIVGYPIDAANIDNVS